MRVDYKNGFANIDFSYLIIKFFIFFFLFFINGLNTVKQSEIPENGIIDISKNPIQGDSIANLNKPIEVKINKKIYQLSPQADYKISGMIVGKNQIFIMDGGSDIAPIDIGLAWGKMAEPKYDKYMKYSSFNRFLRWTYKPGFPLSYYFLNSHVSNNHIIPANNNILKVLKSVKVRENIYMEGLLVNIKSEHKGKYFYWNTSLTRNDKDEGACELLYVKKIRAGNNCYE